MIESDALRAFVVFAEHRNFTRAAAALGLTQPALHTKIGKLSEHLGLALYRRRGRLLELTPAGQQLAAFGRDVHAQCQELLGQLGGEAAPQPVRVAAGEGAIRYLIAEALARFAREEAAPLVLLTRDRTGTLEAVRTGEAHLGITVLADRPEDLHCRTLAVTGHTLAVPTGSPLARLARASAADLAGQRLIAPPPGFPHRGALAELVQAHGVSVDFAVEANGWELMLSLVALGLGVAVVNDCCALPRGVAGIPFDGLPRVRYQLVKRKDRRLPTAARALEKVLG